MSGSKKPLPSNRGFRQQVNPRGAGSQKPEDGKKLTRIGGSPACLTKLDYTRGLQFKIRKVLIPTLTGKETLKDFINKATDLDFTYAQECGPVPFS
jgi:hypothetical protein